jgi:kynurenine formamidase
MSFVWLSHILTNDTPLYGGGSGISVKQEKAIELGDSCNTSVLTMPSHAGTHVDSPYHFLANGKRVDQYAPEDWFFNCPHVIFFSASPGQLITPEDIPLPKQLDEATDMLLLRSGFESYRGTDVYWEAGPGLAPELAEFLITKCPKLRAIGMDFISISSLKHREKGRMAHKEFLQREILIFEDMRLSELQTHAHLQKVIALPLRFAKADGAPVTVIGTVDECSTIKT